MVRCEQVQAQVIEDLYGLLDADASRALRDHLASCPACAAARLEADRLQTLLAAAAKAEFPGVRFTPPTIAPSRPARPLPIRRTGTLGGVRVAALAASILALLALPGIPIGLYLVGRADYQQQLEAARTAEKAAADQLQAVVDAKQAEMRQAREERDAARAHLQKWSEDLRDKVEAAERAVKAKQVYMVVTGPESLQPGAPNEYQIETRSVLNDMPSPAALTVRLRQNGNVVYEQKDIDSRGRQSVLLPPDLQLKQRSQLALEVVATGPSGPQSQLSEQVQLAAPVYITHLATDKPMYKPGETVHFRSLTLNRFNMLPPAEDLQLSFILSGPQGDIVHRLDGRTHLLNKDGKPLLGPDKKPLKGIGAGSFRLDNLVGGEYTLMVSEVGGRFPPEKRKFVLNEYTPDRLEKKLEYDRKTYGPGDEVVANCQAKDGDKPVAHRPVTASARIDGKEFPVAAPATDSSGGVSVRFRLPKDLERGAASLTVTFNDGRGPESLVRPIPVVLKKLTVEFYPEGGDQIVAGVPNRVYFQARTPLGKPAELKGEIVDEKGTKVADVATFSDPQPGLSQGQGAFAFTPEVGRAYRLKVTEPAGTEATGAALPAVRKDGVTLNVPTGVTAEGEPIRVRLQSPVGERKLLVGAYCRGRLLDHARVTLTAGKAAEVELKPEASLGGVTRVTVFEEPAATEGQRQQLKPVAERLVYRQSKQKVDLTVRPGQSRYVPGEKAQLHLSATDETGRPVAAVVMVGVVNQSVVTMADEKTARAMPTHFLLTSEVRKPEDLEYTDVLLGTHPKASLALDLLLGTQGWRRFAEQDPAKFHKEHAAEAERLLVTTGGHSQVLLANTIDQEQEKVIRAAQADFDQTQKDLAGAETKLQALAHDESYRQERAKLGGQAKAAATAAAAATRDASRFEDRYAAVRALVMPLTGLGLLLAGAVVLVLAVIRQARRAVPYYAAAAGVLAASVFLLVQALGTEPIGRGTGQAVALAPAAKAQNEAEWLAQNAAKIEPGALVNLDDGPDIAAAEAERRAAMPPGAGPQPDAMGGAGDKEVRPQMPAKPRDLRPEAGEEKPGEGRKTPPQRAKDEKGRARLDIEAKAFDLEQMKKADGKNDKALREELRGDEAVFKLAEGAFDQKLKYAGTYAPANRAGPAAGKALPDRRHLLELAVPATPPMVAAPGPVPTGLAPPVLGGARMPQPMMMPPHLIKQVQIAPVPVLPPLVVREYAHQHQAPLPTPDPRSSDDDIRRDFTETIFWHPALVLSDEGAATVGFDLADSIGRYQVLVAAHSFDGQQGRLGATLAAIDVRKPFSVDPRLPLEVTASDRLDVPVAIVNDTPDRRPVLVRVDAKGMEFLPGSAGHSTTDQPEVRLALTPDQRTRRVFSFRPTLKDGLATLTVRGQSEPFANDNIKREIRVVPEGFPVVGAHSDVLEKQAIHTLTLPETWVKGSLKVKVNVYPSTLADLQKGLEGLLREPCGCFEQTSTSNYPNLLILDYLKSSDQANPDAARRAKELIDRGYKKLTSFECQNPSEKKREGYEWFGGTAPPHEALTAYGLLQFRDMARVYPVDSGMVERTKQYLMSRKDGKGGFTRNPRALDTFGRAPADVTDAYIVWALTEGGKDDDVEKELAVLREKAKTSKDPYFLALVANALLNRSQTDAAREVLKQLGDFQRKEGCLDGATTSITGSGGRDLQIETTAIAVLAWLKINQPDQFNANLQSAIKWIGQQRGGYGGFGSTQSTILALKALIAYTNANKKTPEGGELRLSVGERVVATTKFEAGVKDAVTLDVAKAEEHFKPGKNEVKVEITGKNAFPFTLGWEYNTLQPLSAEKCAVRLATKLDKLQATEGESVRLTATVENASGKGQGMTVAIVGLPAGLKLPEDMKQLKDMTVLRENGTKPGLISFWEVRGRELVLYWRDLAPGAKVEVPIDLICNVPGLYRGPASRAYLYYNADHKSWAEPLSVAIDIKPGE